MNPSARSALTLAVLLVLPQLQALCPRLAPDVISGKVIPCRYLCIKINFLELPSIILSTERDGVLCSTLLLRRRGVCKNGGCIPFGSDDDIKPKGALGKVIAAIDKFASGSYRQKAPKPGTPFGPIVSTASSLFGGGSSTTSGGTSSAASSIVATATAAAVGSSLKKLFSQSTSSDSKRHNERPTSNPFGPSLPSIPKPDHPANTPGVTLPSSSGAVAVNFGGGPPIVPPSTEGGAENVGPHAAPGTPITNSGVPSAHPALAPFINPPPTKQKDSLSPGSPSHDSNSAGGAITKAIGIVLGNIREMSATPTHGTPSGQQTPGGSVVASKHHLDSSISDFPKTTGVAQNGHIREATSGSGIPTTFPVGAIPPIAQPSSSSRAESDGKERFGGFAASAIQEGHPLITPGAPAVTSFGYKSKLPPTASSPSRLPSIGSQAPGAASRAENSAGPYREVLARLREVSQGSTRNTLPGQPFPAAFGETSVPSSRSSVITAHKSTSDREFTNYKETGESVPSGATPITAGFGYGSPAIFPATRGVAEGHRGETSRWPEAPKEVPRPLNTAKAAAGLPAATLLGASSLPTSNPAGVTSPSVGISPLKPPPTPPSESSSGSLINTSPVKPLQTLKQVAAGKIPAISVRQPSSVAPGVSSAQTNNTPIAILRNGINEPEVRPTKKIPTGPLNDSPTQAAVELNGSALPNPPSTLAAAEKKVAKGSQPSTASSMFERPAVIVDKTADSNINDLRGPSEISGNKPTEKPSSSIGSSRVEHPAAFGSSSGISSQAERRLGSALNSLKRVSGSTIPTAPFRKPPSHTDNTSKPSKDSRIPGLHKDSTGPRVKTAKETAVGPLDGNRTPVAVQLGGGAPSIVPSTVALTESAGAEASRLSTAPSKISRPTLTPVTPAEASIGNVQSPSQIPTTKHGNGPSPPIGSTRLEVVAASRSTTGVTSRMKKTFRRVFSTFIRGRKKTNFRLRQPPQVAKNDTSKPGDSSSIQSIHKGVDHPEIKKNKKTVSGVLPGNPTAGNAQVGSGTPVLLPPIRGAADNRAPGTSPRSSAQNSSLQPSNVASGISEVGLVNMKHKSQVPTNKPANGPLSSIRNSVLESHSATLSSSSSGNRMGKTLRGDMSALRQISKDSAPSEKPSSVALNQKLKPNNSFNHVNGPQRGYIEEGKKGTLHGRAPAIPAAVGEHRPIVQASTEKSPNSNLLGAAQKPAAPALKPVSATAETADSSISGHGAHPQLLSSTTANRSSPSMKAVPVKVATPSLTPGPLESLPHIQPAPDAIPSPKEKTPKPDAGTSKQSNDSRAHSSHSAATARTEPNIRGFGANPPLPSSTLANKPLPSMVTTPVKPTTSSRAPVSLESMQHNPPAPGTTPSSKKLSVVDARTSKQRNDSQAHSSHIAATATATKTSGNHLPLSDAALPSRGTPLLGGSELAGKTSVSRTLTLSKNTVPGKREGHTITIPSRISLKNTGSGQMGSSALPLKHGGTNELPSLPENKKSSASKPSDSDSQSPNLRPVKNILSNINRRSKLKRQKHPRVVQSTRDRGITEGVATPSSRDMNPTKPVTGALLNTGVQGLTLPASSAAVPQTAPSLLSTPSHSREPSSSPIGIKAQATTSSDEENRIINKSIANALTKIKEKVLLKRKENTTGAYNRKGSPGNNVKRLSRGGVEAKIIEGRNGLSKESDQLTSSNYKPPISKLGSASGPIASRPSTVPISLINSTLQASAVQGSKEGLALGIHAGKIIPPTVPSGTSTDRNRNNIKKSETANKYNNNSPPTRASSTAQTPQNTVLPSSTVPSMHGSAFSATATGTKNASPSISLISHVDTVATPSKPTATTGTAFNAHSGNKVVPEPIAARAHQAPVVAATSKSRNSPHGSNQGSETSVPMEGDNVNAKSITSSQSASSSSGRVESKVSTSNDNSSKARSVSPPKIKDDTSTLASEKRSFSSAAQPASIPTLVSKALRVQPASSVPAVHAANREAGILKTTGATEKHTRTTGSLSGIKGSVSIGRAPQGVETPRRSPGTATNTKGNVYDRRTSGPQAGLNASATSRLAATNSEAPGATSDSPVSVRSMAAASKASSRNPSPQTSENEVPKAKNVTTPGSPSDLAASAVINSAPANIPTSKIPSETTTNKIVQNVHASTTPLGSKAEVSAGNASTNANTPGGSAGGSPALTLPGEKIVSSTLVNLTKALKAPPKPSGIVMKLGSFLSGGRNPLRLNVQPGNPAVPNLRSKAATNKGESAVNEAESTTVPQSPTQPAASEKYPSQPTYVASEDRQTPPITDDQQPTSPLYTGMRPHGGIVFGRHPPMPGGFWDAPQAIPGMFRPF